MKATPNQISRIPTVHVQQILTGRVWLLSDSRNEVTMSSDLSSKELVPTVKDFTECGWKEALAQANREGDRQVIS